MASSLPAVLDGVPLAAPSPGEDESQSAGQGPARKRKAPAGSDTGSKGTGRARRGAAKTLSSSFRNWHLMPETHYNLFWNFLFLFSDQT